MIRIRGVALAICMLVFSAIALTACGGDDDDTNGGDSGDEAAAVTTDDQSASDDEATEPVDVEPTEAADASDDGNDDQSGGEGVSDPCSLVTQAEVEAALGEPVQDPVVTYTGTANISGTVPATVSTCAYISPTGASSVNLTSWSAPGESEAVAGMIELACTDKETISGLGDLACYYDDTHAEVQLGSGGFFLDIYVTMNGDASDALVDLSEKAVDRLP